MGQDLPNSKVGSKNKIWTVISVAFVFIFLFGFGIFIWYDSGGFDRRVSNIEENIYQKVASDAVQKYEIAKRSGTAMDACVNAGLMSAAFLQAKDETNYQKSKEIQSADCAAAGLPQ